MVGKIMRNRDLVKLRTLGRVSAVLFALSMLVLPFAASAFAQTPTGQAAPTPPPATLQPSQQQLENWRKNMSAQPPRPGCFTSGYPSNQWQEVRATTALAVPFPPARGPRPNTVGNGNDVSAGLAKKLELSWSVKALCPWAATNSLKPTTSTATGRSDILWVDNTGNVGIWFVNGTSVGSVTFYGNVGIG
jgi:hypothetical protein